MTEEPYFRIIYDEKEKDPSSPRSYDSCRTQVDLARDWRLIDEEMHDHLRVKLTHWRNKERIEESEEDTIFE